MKYKDMSITWRHTNNGAGSVGITECFIRNKDGKEILGGTSVCSPRDNYCKQTGRKLSLARAIKMFNREVRSEIWAEYGAQIGI